MHQSEVEHLTQRYEQLVAKVEEQEEDLAWYRRLLEEATALTTELRQLNESFRRRLDENRRREQELESKLRELRHERDARE